MIDIRNKVKALCKLQGTTQKELAIKIGITENALNVSLRPDGNPALKTIAKIAGGLGVSLSELLSETDEIIPRIETKEVTYLRCPNCGGKIHLYARGDEDEQPQK